MLHATLSLPTLSSSFSPTKTSISLSLSPSQNPPPSLYIKFRNSHRLNLRYLKALGILDPTTKPHKLPSPTTVDHVLVTVNFLKSKGFTEPDFPRLAFLSPQLFSQHFDPTDIVPVFDFLATELSASVEESRGLILRCPAILFSDVEFCLRPTLHYLTQLGMKNLNSPTNLNAHLLNTRADKLRMKISFLESLGFSQEEAKRVCVRLPAMFGYSIDNNLWPKFQYLVEEMERSVEELKAFPQYFGFSLEKKIVPRHLHLKERNVKVPLKKMLLWNDENFYAKWK